MRSVITRRTRQGIAAVVKQQFEVGAQIIGHGLVPILEPEVSIKTPDKKGAEKILRDELHQGPGRAARIEPGDDQADHP